MWISKTKYNELLEANRALQAKIDEYNDDSGEAIIKRLRSMAKEAGLDTFSQEYQDIMSRVFMHLGGRQTSVLKGYSATAFVKDNPEEILQRAAELQKQLSIITKGKVIEDKVKKK